MCLLQHAPVLRRDRLEKLLTLLQDRGGSANLRELTHRRGFRRWEILTAELYGWLRLEHQRRLFHTGRPSTLVCLEEDTRHARPVPEEWQVPYLILPRHRAFALRTLEIIPGRGPFPLKFKSLVTAYRETYPKARCHVSAKSSAAKLFKRGDVQAVRAWAQARLRGSIGADEEMPLTVEGIAWRLQGTEQEVVQN